MVRGVVLGDGYDKFLYRRLRLTRWFVRILVTFSFGVVLWSVWYVVEEVRESPEVWRGEAKTESSAVGSRLSHESQTEDGWSYRLDVEEIVAKNEETSGLFDLAYLRNARVTIFDEEGESLSFYAPEAAWSEKEGVFHMLGGCRVWQGDQFDIKTEEIVVNVKTKHVELPGVLEGRYGDGWFFEASSAYWDIAKDELVFEGEMSFGRKGESL
jgi:hypothetical protein